MKRLGLWVTLLILILLVYILKDINFTEVYRLLLKINLLYFFLAVAASFASILLWNLRCQNAMLSYFKGDFWFLLETLLAGIFVNNITPGASVGGEPVRAYYIGKKYGKLKTKIFGYIVAEKVLHIIVFFVFLIFSSLFIFKFIHVTQALRLILEIALVATIVFASLFAFTLFNKIDFNGDWIARRLYAFKFIRKKFKDIEKLRIYVKRRVNNFLDSFKEVFINRDRFYYGIFISVATWLVTFLSSYFLFLALHVKISFLHVIIGVTFAYLIGDISPIPGGIGVVEGVLFLIYSALGIDPAVALAVALLSRIIYYFFAFLVGGFCLLHLKHKFSNVKENRKLLKS